MTDNINQATNGGSSAMPAVDVHTGELHSVEVIEHQPAITISELKTRLEDMKKRRAAWEEFLRHVLIPDIDYGPFPGCGDKKGLKKAGADAVMKWHKLYAEPVCIAKKEDFEIGLFAYTYRATIRQRGTGIIEAYADGDCNSWENKYRYRWVSRNQVPKGINPDDLPSEVRYSKKKKCEFTLYRLENPNPADQINTYKKMAAKRAIVDAVITAAGIRTFVEALPDDDAENEEEDLQPIGGESPQNAGPDGYKSLIKFSMQSKFGDKEKPSVCAFCGKEHVLKGDQIVVIDGSDGKKMYGSEACLAEHWKKEHPQADQTGTAQPQSPEPTPSQPTPETSPQAGQSGDQKPAADDKLSGPTLTVPQIKAIVEMYRKAGMTEVQFTEWLRTHISKYRGRGINDILQSDFEFVSQAYRGKLL